MAVIFAKIYLLVAVGSFSILRLILRNKKAAADAGVQFICRIGSLKERKEKKNSWRRRRKYVGREAGGRAGGEIVQVIFCFSAFYCFGNKSVLPDRRIDRQTDRLLQLGNTKEAPTYLYLPVHTHTYVCFYLGVCIYITRARKVILMRSIEMEMGKEIEKLRLAAEPSFIALFSFTKMICIHDQHTHTYKKIELIRMKMS